MKALPVLLLGAALAGCATMPGTNTDLQRLEQQAYFCGYDQVKTGAVPPRCNDHPIAKAYHEGQVDAQKELN